VVVCISIRSPACFRHHSSDRDHRRSSIEGVGAGHYAVSDGRYTLGAAVPASGSTAVVDSADADGYLLGIERDGPSYRAMPAARDSDRLRQSVLEGLGWTLHRVWSFDWRDDPEAETRKLKAIREPGRRVVRADFRTPAAPETEGEP
jgi:hypothetical protein